MRQRVYEIWKGFTYYPPIFGKKNVVGFDVAMENTLSGKIDKRVNYWLYNASRLAFRERAYITTCDKGR